MFGVDSPVIEMLRESSAGRLDLVQLFGRTAPLDVDLGCGDGAFDQAGRESATQSGHH
jgi:hypothetical protein